jgi:hypothetical protein
VVELADLVIHLRIILERLKAVCAATGNVKRSAIIVGQLNRHPVLVGQGIPTQIYGHVVDCTRNAADHFILAVGRHLIVHSAQGALPLIERRAALRHAGVQAMSLKLVLAESAGEEAPLVLDSLCLDDENPLELGFDENHSLFSTRQMSSNLVFSGDSISPSGGLKPPLPRGLALVKRF